MTAQLWATKPSQIDSLNDRTDSGVRESNGAGNIATLIETCRYIYLDSTIKSRGMWKVSISDKLLDLGIIFIQFEKSDEELRG
jgi:hypothetical protein